MREILFRGKPIVEEELMEPNETLKEFFKRQHDWSDYGVDEAFTDDGFVIGQVVYDGKKAWIVGEVVEAKEDYITLEYWVPVIPQTVGQYTGLKDKNGVKIFEGDVFSDGSVCAVAKTRFICDPKCTDLYTKPKEQTGERIKELESLCRELVTTLEGAVFWLKGAGYSVEDYLFMASKAKEVLGDE